MGAVAGAVKETGIVYADLKIILAKRPTGRHVVHLAIGRLDGVVNFGIDVRGRSAGARVAIGRHDLDSGIVDQLAH